MQCSHTLRWSVTGWLQRHSAEDNSTSWASTFSLVAFLSGEGQPVLVSHPLSQPTNTRASTATVAVIPPMQAPSQLD